MILNIFEGLPALPLCLSLAICSLRICSSSCWFSCSTAIIVESRAGWEDFIPEDRNEEWRSSSCLDRMRVSEAVQMLFYSRLFLLVRCSAAGRLCSKVWDSAWRSCRWERTSGSEPPDCMYARCKDLLTRSMFLWGDGKQIQLNFEQRKSTIPFFLFFHLNRANLTEDKKHLSRKFPVEINQTNSDL